MPDPGVHLAQVNCALSGGTSLPRSTRPPHRRLSRPLQRQRHLAKNLYRNGEFVDTYNTDREFHLLLEYLNAHAEPTGTSQEEVVPSPALAPASTEQEAIPTLTPTPAADRLIVQTPRTDANPSGTVVSLDVQTFDDFLSQGPAFIKFFAPW
jgi:hypothetical protein